jgi:hypothetical protein
MAYTVLGDGMERAFGKIMRMYSRVAELKNKPMPIYGNDDGGMYNETFTGADLADWTRCTVKWDSFIGSDHTEKLHNALLLWQANPQGYPWRRVLEEAGEEDPDRLIAEAKAVSAQMQAQQPQGPPSSGPGGNPPPGSTPNTPPSPGPAQPAPDQGAQPPAPPGLPNFPQSAVAPENMGVPQPAPLPDIMSELWQAVQGIVDPSEILEMRPEEGGIYVKVANHKDIKPVRDAITPVAQNVYGAEVRVTVKAQSSRKE